MLNRSHPLRAVLMASLCVMLSACATVSKTPALTEAPKPVIVTKTETVAVCPAEIKGAVGGLPTVPADAVIQGNQAGQDWLSAVVSYATGLRDRFTDAQKACPK